MGGHTWTPVVNNVTDVLDEHINDMHDDKADNKDGVTVKTDTYVLTIPYMITDNIFVMNAAGDKEFTLPSVAAEDIGIGCVLAKVGTGKLTIQAADSDKINDSSAGGTLFNALAEITWGAVIIKLITETQWIAFPLGIGWITT